MIGVLELAVKPPAPPRARVEPEGGDIAAGPELPATGHERVARLGGRDEVHVAMSRGDDDVGRDRTRQRVVERGVDHVHGDGARMHSIPLEDLLVQDHRAARYRYR